jgi:tripeptidyl-peptidase-1
LPIFPAACPYVTSLGSTRNVEPEVATSFSSGGFSDLFPRPDYQNHAVNEFFEYLGDQWKGLYNPNGWGFPDVAAQGVRFHVIDKNGGPTELDLQFSGTSASAPTFASIITLLNNARLSTGLPPLGFLNPWIYSTGRHAMNDIVNGSSTGCTGTDQFSGLPTPFVPGASWKAVKGWDPVSGYGTPNFERPLNQVAPNAVWNSMKKWLISGGMEDELLL